MNTSTYRISGMTCEHCVAAVNEQMVALDGVADVRIHLVADGISSVTVESVSPLAPEAVAAAVEEAGYTLA